jgi:hypothetical protein
MNPNIQQVPAEPISNTQIGEGVQQILGHDFTGLVKIAYLLGEEVTLLIQNGVIVEILLQDKNVRQFLPGEKFQGLFEPSRTGYLIVQNTPGKCLLFERACFDSQTRESRKGTAVADLERLFTQLKARESASVAVLRWKSAQAYALIPGSNLSVRRAIFLRGEQVESDDAAFAAISALPEPYCNVTLYQGSFGSDAWISLHLNILFEHLSANMLSQYGYLTGRVMVNSITRGLSYTAQELGCELTGLGNQPQVQTIFRTTSEAVTVYKDLLGYMEKQMATMVGSSFINAMKKQSQNALNPFYSNIIQFYGL